MAQQAADELTSSVYRNARHVTVPGWHAVLRPLPRGIRREYLVPWIAVVVHRLEEPVSVDDGADEIARECRSVGLLLCRRVVHFDDLVERNTLRSGDGHPEDDEQ